MFAYFTILILIMQSLLIQRIVGLLDEFMKYTLECKAKVKCHLQINSQRHVCEYAHCKALKYSKYILTMT